MPIITFLAAFVVAAIFASFFEWAVHKYVMHKPIPGFKYPFRAHAVVHHQIFRSDHTYHLIKESDKETIPMAWWNGPVLILLGSLPFAAISWMLGDWWILGGAATAIAGYYGVYESIHWCMHLPKSRKLESIQLFRRLNGHHLLHHRYSHKNFNVVLPLADLFLGTLMLRSKIKFPQAMGPAVPDVQPIG